MAAKEYTIERKIDPRDPHLGISISDQVRSDAKLAEEFDNTCYKYMMVKCHKASDDTSEYFMLSTENAPEHLKTLNVFMKELKEKGWTGKYHL